MTDDEILATASKSGLCLLRHEYLFRDIILDFARAIAQKQCEKDAEICSKRAESLRAHNDKSLEGMINTADGLADAILAQGEEYGHR